MNQFSNDIFKDIPEPGNFKELLELVFTPSNHASGLVRMWRGQSDINWKIDSSAYRRINQSKEKVSNDDLIFYEERLLMHAKHKGYHISNGRLISDLELLALLQHNGAATRLVDFSRSAFIALWFAVAYNTDKTGLLFGADTYYLGGYEGETNDDSYEDTIKSLHKLDHPVTWEPTTISPRVAAQHSQFLYSEVSNSKYGSLKLASESEANLLIAINTSLKMECKALLVEVFDIREQTLFPDLSGFGEANNSFKNIDDMLRW